MKKFTLLAVMLLWASMIMCQNLQVTFTGTGEATVVDSVIAKNVSTGEEITLPGNEILILENTSGISDNIHLSSELKLFPNPVQGNSKLMFNQPVTGNVQLTVQNISGQILYQSDEYLEVGQYLFDLSLNKVGIFLINLTSENETRSIKAICAKANNNPVGLSRESSNPSSFKSFNSTYSLVYSPEDVLNFRGKSGSYTTIMTDSPTESRNYELEFIDCTDAQNNSYSVIKIGEQIWMEENLAYLPAVTTNENVSYTEALYYVYEYVGSSISEAQNTNSYKDYGVLYNWQAAKNACPAGWHLPEKGEWETLFTYLKRNGYGFELDTEIGKSLAASYDWNAYVMPGTVGNDLSSNNKSGFCWLPAGNRNSFGFQFQREQGSFWSSTSLGPLLAYTTRLGSGSREIAIGNGDLRYGLPVRCIKDI